MSSLYALVLAGGRGTRFWPRSRRERPKQCVAIHGDRSYLQQTVERLLPIIPKERILIATGRDRPTVTKDMGRKIMYSRNAAANHDMRAQAAAASAERVAG